jgi:hypothetical protein
MRAPRPMSCTPCSPLKLRRGGEPGRDVVNGRAAVDSRRQRNGRGHAEMKRRGSERVLVPRWFVLRSLRPPQLSSTHAHALLAARPHDPQRPLPPHRAATSGVTTSPPCRGAPNPPRERHDGGGRHLARPRRQRPSKRRCPALRTASPAENPGLGALGKTPRLHKRWTPAKRKAPRVTKRWLPGPKKAPRAQKTLDTRKKNRAELRPSLATREKKRAELRRSLATREKNLTELCRTLATRDNNLAEPLETLATRQDDRTEAPRGHPTCPEDRSAPRRMPVPCPATSSDPRGCRATSQRTAPRHPGAGHPLDLASLTAVRGRLESSARRAALHPGR